MPFRPRVYCAGPITKPAHAPNVHEGLKKFFELQAAGFDVFLPHLSVYSEIFNPGAMSYEDWLAYDFNWIRGSHALFRMPGASSGAEREVAFAQGLGLPVFTDLAEMVRWKEETFTQFITTPSDTSVEDGASSRSLENTPL